MKRERVFYKNRMASNLERARAADRKLVAENEHLLPRIRASAKVAAETMVTGELGLENMVELDEIKVPTEPTKIKMKV